MKFELTKLVKLSVTVVITSVCLQNCIPKPGDNINLYPYMVHNDSTGKNLWGYMDSTGKTIIEPQFHNARNFYNGYAKVFVCKGNGKSCPGAYGVINKQGKLVIAPEFEKVGKLSSGLIRLSHPEYKKDKELIDGYYTADGKLAIPCKLDDFKFNQNNDFSEGLAVVCPPITPEQYKKLKGGEEFIPYTMRLLENIKEADVYSTSNLYGYIDVKGKIVIPNKFDYATDFSEGLAFVRRYGDEKAGFIDKTGEFVIRPQYYNGSSFSEGLASVLLETKKYGFISKQGQLVIPAQFDRVGDFKEGLAWVRLNNKYGFINKQGELVVDTIFSHVGDFSEGLAAVGIAEGWKSKYGFINTSGELVIPHNFYGYIKAPKFDNGLCVVSIREKNPETEREIEKTGYINKKGEWVYGPIEGDWFSFSFSIK